jgi:hypothetical protein
VLSGLKGTLFLGAGFSKWAAGLPVVSELFDFDIVPWGRREQRKMESVISLKEEWDRENPGGLAEQFIADALSLPARDREIVLWYVVRRLSKPFIWEEFHAQKWRRHVMMIDENRRFRTEGVLRARDFIRQFRGTPRGIITTNYDLLVEYALGTKGFNYGIPGEQLIGRGAYPLAEWRNPVRVTGEISLAKIHGSISWDEDGRYTDGRRGLTGHALIVAPTEQKRPPELLRDAWRLAEDILSKSTELIVFGFSFNEYDEAVLNLLKFAGRNLKSVLLIDIDPKVARAERIWPSVSIESRSPPTG